MRYILGGLAVLASSALAVDGPPHERMVGVTWQWFTDYAYLSAKWTLDAEVGCEVEVGTGLKVSWRKLGSRHRFTGHYTFTTYGIGSVHVRAVGGRAPCQVRLTEGEVSAVPVYGDPSVIKGIVRDGTIIYESISK